MTGAELRSVLFQAAFVGAATGNVAVAPFIGQGSVAWFVFVFLMFVAVATIAPSFRRLFVLALLSLPVLYTWQSLHQFEPPASILAFQFGFVVLSSQAAGGCALGFQKLRGR
jgi:hypothetical protein